MGREWYRSIPDSKRQQNRRLRRTQSSLARRAGNVIDYDGRHMAFYENGIMRDPEGSVVGLGKDPIGPHPVLPNKGLIPQAIKAAAAPKKSKPQKVLKKPQAVLLWSRKMLEEL